MSTDIDKLAQEIQELPLDEQRRLQRALNEKISQTSDEESSAEKEFFRQLVAAGLIEKAELPARDADAFHKRVPVKIEGKPLSETIIEERR